MNSPPRLIQPSAMSFEEAAIYTGFSYPQIQELVRSKKLPVSKIGRTRVIRRAALDRLLHETQVAVEA